MRRRITGLKLDGRHDVAATDWSDDGDDTAIRIVAGGTAGSIITSLHGGHRVAGPQAQLAPHGRGQGWGNIGEGGRRRPLAQAIDSHGGSEEAIKDIAASIDALARGADEVIVAVPDLPDFDEAVQGAMIRACSTRRRRARLLWQPVPIMLSLIHDGLIGAADMGKRFRLLIHAAHGIEDQTLVLREDREHAGHLAPQRDGPGRLLVPEVGLDALFKKAHDQVCRSAPIDWTRCEPSRLGPLLLAGEAHTGQAEILRHINGNWQVLGAPELNISALGVSRTAILPPAGPVENTFFVTPLAAPYADALVAAFKSTIGPLSVFGDDLIARGCLLAGRLIERGLPHYFDRLEPIAIAVMSGDQPVFEHLIPPDHVVAANREFVSRDLHGFIWPRNRSETEFYILKGSDEVRHWKVVKDESPMSDVEVMLRIRQTPGQSWARLTVSSKDWDALARAPIGLNWETLTPRDQSPEEVLEKLRTPPPTIPQRIIEEAHVDLWNGAYWTNDGEPARFARNVAQGGQVLAAEWAGVLGRAKRHPEDGLRYWLVGTDGTLPQGLPHDLRNGFERVVNELAAATSTNRHLGNNDHLRALTWCFTACPESVQDLILDALEAHKESKSHFLLRPRGAFTVVRQGAGRSIAGADRLKRLFVYLAGTSLNNDTINALAMAVTRREEAPKALVRTQVDHFLKALGAQLLEQVKSRHFQVKFRNTLAAIAGLFRWRAQEPFALLAERDAAAKGLREVLLEAGGITAGALLYTAHAKGMQAVHDARERQAWDAFEANLAAERENHAQLADLARELAGELATARAENVRLRAALAQRQAYIDRLRG